MSPATKKLLLRVPGMAVLRELRVRYRDSRRLAEDQRRFAAFKDAREVFTHHYAAKEWGSGESVSGPGSTVAYTQNIRAEIPKLIAQLGVKTLLDAPCGDYNWFRLIERNRHFSYIGGDVVEPLVKSNQDRFGSDDTRFISLNIIEDALPAADLWLCRDCLFHFSFEDIFRTLANFARSEIPYLLTSSHPECRRNMDIVTGSHRLLNLRLPPFDLCAPERSIDDWIEGAPVRELCLWKREEIAAAVRAHGRLTAAE